MVSTDSLRSLQNSLGDRAVLELFAHHSWEDKMQRSHVGSPGLLGGRVG